MEIGAISECTLMNSFDSGNFDRSEGGAIKEGIVVDISHRVGNFDRSEGFAISEGITGNIIQIAIRSKCDRGEVCAVFEGVEVNFSHRVGNCD